MNEANRLIATANGIWAAQVLSTAIQMNVFDFLETDGNRPKDLQEIVDGVHIKALRAEDFFNALASMEHIKKDNGKYCNTPEGSKFCVKASPLYIGMMLERRGDIHKNDFTNLTAYMKGETFGR